MNKRSDREKSLIVDYLKEFERYCLEQTDKKSYFDNNLRRVEKLKEISPENPYYYLMEAAVLIRAGRVDKAEAILKKYERNPALQFRDADFRAGFLYLAGLLAEDWNQRKNIVLQLQKLYQKNAAQRSLYWYLTQLDEGFEKNPEKKLDFLEKQWNLGCRQNLLYIEVIRTLKKYPKAADNLGTFLTQCYIWAQRRRCITKEMSTRIAVTAMRLKRYEPKQEYLLRECYRFFSTKELLTALCSLYICDGRTDPTAAYYYGYGVQFNLRLNNLYEYYMMSITEKKKELLPEQVLLYFLYHNTLSDSQRVYLYKNIICYGEKDSEIYGKYIEKIERYTVESLLKRRINTEYAYLYDQLLYPEIFTPEMAEAMADLMFLRKITCTDPKIREVEVSYDQLKKSKRAILKRKQAYLPIYCPSAVVTLIDAKGNLYRNTVSYEMEKLLDEKKYIEVCKKYVKNHAGILLYLFGKNREYVAINEKTEIDYRQIPETAAFKESYKREAVFHLMEYAARQDQLERIPKSWFDMDGSSLSREQRGKIITFLIQSGRYSNAFAWIEKYGSFHVPAGMILKMLTALTDQKEAEEELYYRLCYGAFRSGQMNYLTLKYLSNEFLGTCAQMAEIWEKAKAYGVETFELEERILMQMLFTETELKEHFKIYLSYNQRNPDETIKKAYLTYMSREAFVKKKTLDDRFYFLLEEEMFAKQGYADICKLAYLKELSERKELSAKQKSLAASCLKYFFVKKYYYKFMQKFGKIIPEALLLEDKVIIEYSAPADSQVTLQYKIEKGGKAEQHYITCRMYSACGGVYSQIVTLFEGEKITYFITEKKADGKEISTPAVTEVKTNCFTEAGTKYERINHMRQLQEEGNEQEFSKEMQQFRYLDLAVKRLFSMK